MISLIDVACGAFGGLLCVAMTLIDTTPPRADATPSGVVVVRLPTTLSADLMTDLLIESIEVDEAGGSTPPAAGEDWSREWPGSLTWCDKLTISTEFRAGREAARVLRIQVERLREPARVTYRLRSKSAGWAFDRTIPRGATITAAGTLFDNELRLDLESEDGALGVTDGDGFTIRLDSRVRSREDLVEAAQ